MSNTFQLFHVACLENSRRKCSKQVLQKEDAYLFSINQQNEATFVCSQPSAILRLFFSIFQLFSQSFLFLLRRNLLTALLAHLEMFHSLIAGRHGAESQLHDIHLKLVHIYLLSVSSNKSNFILFNVFIVLQNILGES